MARALATLALVASVFATSFASKYTFSNISFEEIPVPEGDDVRKFHGFTKMTIDGVEHSVSYTPLLESGKSYPGFVEGEQWQVGTIVDKFGRVITKEMDPAADPALARSFDRASLFTRFGKIWAVVHNEADYGSVFLLELNQSSTGELGIVRAKTINLGAAFGTIKPCSASVTPWKSHLLGEEHLVEAKDFPNPDTGLEKLGMIHGGIQWNQTNPYWIGYNIEIFVSSSSGDTIARKRFAMGRVKWELGLVLPDRRTVIGTDDITGGGVLLMFIADKAGDLRKGRLYAAALTQLYGSDDGSFAINWIPLNPDGSSVHEDDVKKYISGATYQKSKITFYDMFEFAPVVFLDADNTTIDYSKMPAGFKTVKTEGTKLEWLKLKPGMGWLASRLETRRMAAYMGATNELTKLEGLAYDDFTNVMYMSVTTVRRAMADSPLSYDLGGPNQVRLPENVPGVVYALHLDSKYQPKLMKAVVSSFGYNSSLTVNSVPQTSIAGPDNIGFMHKYRVLLISEDSRGQHANNYLWAYNTLTGNLTRIFAASIDAGVTSGYYFPNVGKFSYLVTVVTKPASDVAATVGYWVFPKDDSVFTSVSF